MLTIFHRTSVLVAKVINVLVVNCPWWPISGTDPDALPTESTSIASCRDREGGHSSVKGSRRRESFWQQSEIFQAQHYHAKGSKHGSIFFIAMIVLDLSGLGLDVKISGCSKWTWFHATLELPRLQCRRQAAVECQREGRRPGWN